MEDGSYKDSAPLGGIRCAECKKSDRLYSDSHGTFCHRCGPSVPMEPIAKFAVYAPSPQQQEMK